MHQEAKEKLQLEKWKANVLDTVTNKIAKIHKIDNNGIEAQREEIKSSQAEFLLEIKALSEKILKLKRKKKIGTKTDAKICTSRINLKKNIHNK